MRRSLLLALPFLLTLVSVASAENWPTWRGPRSNGISTEKNIPTEWTKDTNNIAWRLPLGKYAPGIATERTYFLSLNGRLIATPGRDAPAPRTSG